MPQITPVGTTARLTAAERAAESARPDRLFDDPFAALLAGEAGRELAAHFSRTTPFDNPTVAVRTRFFDDALTALVAGSAAGEQIVLLAAGMDTRAYRLGFPPGTTVYEVDRPEVLGLKASLLAGVGAETAAPSCALRAVAADLAHDWPSALRGAGLSVTRPVCWLVEGLTPYLTTAEVDLLLDRITALSAPGSHLMIDVLGQSLLEHPALQPMLEHLAQRGMAWVFGTETPEALLTRRGWQAQATCVGEVGNELDRWPFPMLHEEPGGCHRVTLSTRGGDRDARVPASGTPRRVRRCRTRRFDDLGSPNKTQRRHNSQEAPSGGNSRSIK
ncbi:S-adenosyl-L-methionine-dependent methyltransferase [Mycolicibacterium chitae]|nr:SAM-dependent methyltransferase [Mycolicibacterium chitae]BBZ01979.1 S-adenosyl-L-methionine-dependent methyltransferase [Mycolicibacterium chitae]